jgi:hypothetical protein
MLRERRYLIFPQLLLLTRVQLRAALCGLLMLLLVARQEVAKKRAQAFPLGTPLALPLYKENRGEKHINFSYISRRFATTSGRQGRQNRFFRNFVKLGRGKQ